jgi:hypothetical protein
MACLGTKSPTHSATTASPLKADICPSEMWRWKLTAETHDDPRRRMAAVIKNTVCMVTDWDVWCPISLPLYWSYNLDTCSIPNTEVATQPNQALNSQITVFRCALVPQITCSLLVLHSENVICGRYCSTRMQFYCGSLYSLLQFVCARIVSYIIRVMWGRRILVTMHVLHVACLWKCGRILLPSHPPTHATHRPPVIEWPGEVRG